MSDMQDMKPFTKAETIKIMLVEAQNELVKCDVMNALHFRMSLKGSKGKNEELMALNQSKMRHLESTIKDLEGMLQEELAKQLDRMVGDNPPSPPPPVSDIVKP